MSTSDDLKTLRIRTRRTYSGDGERHVAAVVPCPVRSAPTALATCEYCPRCSHLTIGEARSEVHCRPGDPPAASPAVEPSPGSSSADATPLSALMQVDVLCAAADLEVGALARLLTSYRVGAVPVVDHKGHPVGVVSRTDLVEAFHGRDKLRVADIMMNVAFTLPEHASIAQAAALMAVEGIHQVPVVASDGTVVGMVGALDILAWLAAEDGYLDRAS